MFFCWIFWHPSQPSTKIMYPGLHTSTSNNSAYVAAVSHAECSNWIGAAKFFVEIDQSFMAFHYRIRRWFGRNFSLEIDQWRRRIFVTFIRAPPGTWRFSSIDVVAEHVTFIHDTLSYFRWSPADGAAGGAEKRKGCALPTTISVSVILIRHRLLRLVVIRCTAKRSDHRTLTQLQVPRR